MIFAGAAGSSPLRVGPEMFAISFATMPSSAGREVASTTPNWSALVETSSRRNSSGPLEVNCPNRARSAERVVPGSGPPCTAAKKRAPGDVSGPGHNPGW